MFNDIDGALESYVVRSLADIQGGDEITVSYGDSYFAEGGWLCKCQSCLAERDIAEVVEIVPSARAAKRAYTERPDNTKAGPSKKHRRAPKKLRDGEARGGPSLQL